MEMTIYDHTYNHEAPVIYLPVFEGKGEDVDAALQKLTATPYALVCLSGFNWDADLSPWTSEPLFKGDDFAGRGEDTLTTLVDTLIPQAEDNLRVSQRCLAGYSLAGLFALWAGTATDAFDGFVSASGSLWFPGFTDYLEEQGIKENTKVYLSLGSKEHKVRNQVMRTVRDNTEKVRNILMEQGHRVIFEVNPGNHFTDPAGRTAKGISWLLDD